MSTPRYEYDAITPAQFISRLNRLDIKRDEFARLTGMQANNLAKLCKDREFVPHHLHLTLHLFEQCGDAIAEARDLAASTIYADNEHPEWGEYPLQNVEAAQVS
jgi:hypothetical protein